MAKRKATNESNILEGAKRLLKLSQTTRLLAEALSAQAENLATLEAYVSAQPWYDDDEFEIVQLEIKKQFARADAETKRAAPKAKKKGPGAAELAKALELLKSFEGPEQ